MTLKQLLWFEMTTSRYSRRNCHMLWSLSKTCENINLPPCNLAKPRVLFNHNKAYHVTTTFQQVRKQKAAEVSKVKTKQDGQVTLAKKVTQAGQDATYVGVIILGVGVTGALFYFIGRELFSGQSPSGLYGKALKECRKHPEVIDELGDPIKGQGEMNRRGRARFVSHLEYEKDGVKHMRIKFYLKGVLRSGTAHLEVKQNDSGKYETRYLFVEVDKYPYKTIVVEDNR